ncbi:hypothetical protein H5410_019651 [Solanum commersonii]|uniref:Transposase-associated domain-containing protein n=1 Tax=Solanum commersonii TaxID=4109 RepID=A0A9J5Z6W1_SOLCO|nr:hypothetical protein H5410_019651 [Solanum commersonii]
MHLMMNGFKPGYTVWTSHGEFESDTVFNNFVVGESSRSTEHNYFQGSRMSDMINDAFGMHFDFEQGENVEEAPNEEANIFYEQLRDCSSPLFNGSQHFKLSVAVRLLSIKFDNNISQGAMDSMIDLMKELVDPNEKELGRPVPVEEMFKVTHVKKSMNPTEEERWIDPRAQETYVRTPFKLNLFFFSLIGIYEYLRNIVVLYLLRVGTDHLHKKKMRIFGNRVLKRRIRRRKSLDIVVHHPQASMAGIERQYLRWRREEERQRERKRDEEIAAANKVENKRYAALQAQLTFLFESGNIFPPCPANSDGSDQEGDENDKFDKESEGDEE